MTISEFVAKLEALKEAHGDIPVVASSIMGGFYEPDPEARSVELEVRDKRRFALMRHGALLVCLHAVVWAFVLWATSDGDCTKSGDCKQGEYCKAGTCVPKRPSEESK